ncbi:Rhodanese-like domain-containing protein [Sordaria brevicollis]|uniref:Rhodanese-like domain-containing protein n=1 Tax=Sordaria brevicollis TaxID=83679 RepID=A0AAE0U2D1_SORBR|nr:Rhodanese-like domain-containing protein [Sordaria brevicollis]
MSTAPETAAQAAQAAPAPAPAPWYAAFPEPQSDLKTISREEVLEMLKGNTGEKAGKDFILVDLRRNDFEGGTLSSSLNLPAQSLHPTLPTLYTLLKSAGTTKVIFYCGSSTGRGSRCARWFSDYLVKVGDTSTESAGGIQSLALLGGIKGWVAAGGEYLEFVEGFEGSVWERAKSQ